MKRWLITTSANQNLDEIRRKVAEQGGRLRDAPPVPLDHGEQVVEAEGPDDLPGKLANHSLIRKVSPNSDIGLYGPE